jgi:hypothetical protein
VICPRCAEDNSDTFRFCGMCGTLLENRLETRRPIGAPVQGLPKVATAPEAQRPLHSPAASQSNPNQANPDHLDSNQPSIESLREKSFSGLDSFFEAEQPKTGGRRLLLLLVLLAALGAAGWWTYTNYLGATATRTPEGVPASAQDVATDKASAKPAARDAAPPDAGSAAPVVTPSADPETGQKTTEADQTPVAAAKPIAPSASPSVTSAKPAPAARAVAKPPASTPGARAPKLPEPSATENGDADFRKAEAYLYGRGAPENCDQAVKYLKAASSKSNAKARSAFGTMYATGHCVPRDLPTSYLWFAQALHVDPNNQILEKDLSAVWNQMTPPERQMATRMKQ